MGMDPEIDRSIPIPMGMAPPPEVRALVPMATDVDGINTAFPITPMPMVAPVPPAFLTESTYQQNPDNVSLVLRPEYEMEPYEDGLNPVDDIAGYPGEDFGIPVGITLSPLLSMIPPTIRSNDDSFWETLRQADQESTYALVLPGPAAQLSTTSDLEAPHVRNLGSDVPVTSQTMPREITSAAAVAQAEASTRNQENFAGVANQVDMVTPPNRNALAVPGENGLEAYNNEQDNANREILKEVVSIARQMVQDIVIYGRQFLGISVELRTARNRPRAIGRLSRCKTELEKALAELSASSQQEISKLPEGIIDTVPRLREYLEKVLELYNAMQAKMAEFIAAAKIGKEVPFNLDETTTTNLDTFAVVVADQLNTVGLTTRMFQNLSENLNEGFEAVQRNIASGINEELTQVVLQLNNNTTIVNSQTNQLAVIGEACAQTIQQMAQGQEATNQAVLALAQNLRTNDNAGVVELMQANGAALLESMTEGTDRMFEGLEQALFQLSAYGQGRVAAIADRALQTVDTVGTQLVASNTQLVESNTRAMEAANRSSREQSERAMALMNRLDENNAETRASLGRMETSIPRAVGTLSQAIAQNAQTNSNALATLGRIETGIPTAMQRFTQSLSQAMVASGDRTVEGVRMTLHPAIQAIATAISELARSNDTQRFRQEMGLITQQQEQATRMITADIMGAIGQSTSVMGQMGQVATRLGSATDTLSNAVTSAVPGMRSFGQLGQTLNNISRDLTTLGSNQSAQTRDIITSANTGINTLADLNREIIRILGRLSNAPIAANNPQLELAIVRLTEAVMARRPPGGGPVIEEVGDEEMPPAAPQGAERAKSNMVWGVQRTNMRTGIPIQIGTNMSGVKRKELTPVTTDIQTTPIDLDIGNNPKRRRTVKEIPINSLR